MSHPKPELRTTPYVVMCYLVRIPGITLEEFRRYYEEHHMPLVLRIMEGPYSPMSHTRHYIDRSAPGVFPFGGKEAMVYDCVTQLEYKDKQTCEESFKAFAEHTEAVQADEKNFLDASKTVIVLLGESPVTVWT